MQTGLNISLLAPATTKLTKHVLPCKERHLSQPHMQSELDQCRLSKYMDWRGVEILFGWGLLDFHSLALRRESVRMSMGLWNLLLARWYLQSLANFHPGCILISGYSIHLYPQTHLKRGCCTNKKNIRWNIVSRLSSFEDLHTISPSPRPLHPRPPHRCNWQWPRPKELPGANAEAASQLPASGPTIALSAAEDMIYDMFFMYFMNMCRTRIWIFKVNFNILWKGNGVIWDVLIYVFLWSLMYISALKCRPCRQTNTAKPFRCPNSV